MDEFKLAKEAVYAVTGDDRYVHWAPGDATVYRVAYLHRIAFDFDVDARKDLVALVITVGRDEDPTAMNTIVVPQPRESRPWSAGRFYAAYGRQFAGWWAGVRPLLAALHWTTSECDSLDYDPDDAVMIELVAREGVRR